MLIVVWSVNMKPVCRCVTPSLLFLSLFLSLPPPKARFVFTLIVRPAATGKQRREVNQRKLPIHPPESGR